MEKKTVNDCTIYIMLWSFPSLPLNDQHEHLLEHVLQLSGKIQNWGWKESSSIYTWRPGVQSINKTYKHEVIKTPEEELLLKNWINVNQCGWISLTLKQMSINTYANLV